MTWIGIMEGRLVPPSDGRLQSFPAGRWEEEFPLAASAGLNGIEWIYDLRGSRENPLVTGNGRERMADLSSKNGIAVRSVCADYFMERTLLKGDERERDDAARHFSRLVDACASAGIRRIVLPFVDSSAIETDRELEDAVRLLHQLKTELGDREIEIHLETSLEPPRFLELLSELPSRVFRVNYDSGNSASLGFLPEEEFDVYGDRVGSVHIKDRIRHGGTVPLGEGDTDFDAVFGGLRDLGYEGPFILQVARAEAGGEVEWARQNASFVLRYWGHT